MFVTPHEAAYLRRDEAVGRLHTRLRYLSEDEARALVRATKPSVPEVDAAVRAAWGLATVEGRLREAVHAVRYVGAFIASARRPFPGGHRWPAPEPWRTLDERASRHALALVTGDLLADVHLELLYDAAFELERFSTDAIP